MRNCYVLPGFPGSELSTVSSGHRIWLDLAAIAVGSIGLLELAPNGVDAGGKSGVPMKVGAPLRQYYADPIDTLADQLRGDGYVTFGWGYDWRIDMRAAAEPLANEIRSFVTPEEPCAIVCHSTGGLVARMVYASLVDSGHANRVRRIITVGTPHLGTYNAVAFLSGRHLTLNGISVLTGLTTGLTAGTTALFPVSGNPFWSEDDLGQLAASWPALYQLFPFALGEPPNYDQFRYDIYDAQFWVGAVRPSQVHLDNARGPFQTRITYPSAHIPPPWVLTMIGSGSEQALYKLVDPTKIGKPLNIAARDQFGDGTVALGSAFGLVGPKIQVMGDHMNIFTDAIERGMIRREILMDRLMPPPPTAPEVYNAVDPQLLEERFELPLVIDRRPPSTTVAPIPFPTYETWRAVRDP